MFGYGIAKLVRDAAVVTNEQGSYYRLTFEFVYHEKGVAKRQRVLGVLKSMATGATYKRGETVFIRLRNLHTQDTDSGTQLCARVESIYVVKGSTEEEDY